MAKLTEAQLQSIAWAKSFKAKRAYNDDYVATDGSGVSAMYGYWMALFMTSPRHSSVMPGDGAIGYKAPDGYVEGILEDMAKGKYGVTNNERGQGGKYDNVVQRIDTHHRELKKVVDYYQVINKKLEELTLEEHKWHAPRFALGLKVNAVVNLDDGYEMYTLTVAFLPGSGVSSNEQDVEQAFNLKPQNYSVLLGLAQGGAPTGHNFPTDNKNNNYPMDHETGNRAFTAFPDFTTDTNTDESGVYIFANTWGLPGHMAKIGQESYFTDKVFDMSRPYQNHEIWGHPTTWVPAEASGFTPTNYNGHYIDVVPGKTYYELGVKVPYAFNQSSPNPDGADTMAKSPYMQYYASGTSLSGIPTIAIAKEEDVWHDSGVGIIHLQVNMWTDITRVVGLVLDGVNYFNKNGIVSIDAANKTIQRKIDTILPYEWKPEPTEDDLHDACIQCVNLWPWGMTRFEENLAYPRYGTGGLNDFSTAYAFKDDYTFLNPLFEQEWSSGVSTEQFSKNCRSIGRHLPKYRDESFIYHPFAYFYASQAAAWQYLEVFQLPASHLTHSGKQLKNAGMTAENPGEPKKWEKWVWEWTPSEIKTQFQDYALTETWEIASKDLMWDSVNHEGVVYGGHKTDFSPFSFCSYIDTMTGLNESDNMDPALVMGIGEIGACVPNPQYCPSSVWETLTQLAPASENKTETSAIFKSQYFIDNGYNYWMNPLSGNTDNETWWNVCEGLKSIGAVDDNCNPLYRADSLPSTVGTNANPGSEDNIGCNIISVTSQYPLIQGTQVMGASTNSVLLNSYYDIHNYDTHATMCNNSNTGATMEAKNICEENYENEHEWYTWITKQMGLPNGDPDGSEGIGCCCMKPDGWQEPYLDGYGYPFGIE